MSRKKALLTGDISLSEALNSQQTILSQLKLPADQQNFYEYILENADNIRSIIIKILGIKKTQLHLSTSTAEWLRGSFNVCVPLRVHRWKDQGDKVFIFRVPLPYKIGESFNPGNVDEKLRSEAGTFVWIKRNCPEIPVAPLRGFGLTNGNMFVTSETQGRQKSFLKPFSSSADLKHQPHALKSIFSEEARELGTGFMLLDFVRDLNSEMLAVTWKSDYRNQVKRRTFFTHLSRIMLSLARIPHNEIASPCFNDDCTVSFTNRPMISQLVQMENEKIQIPLRRGDTYSRSSAYISDLLRCQDNWLYDSPNSVADENDAIFQASVIAGLRAIQPDFVFGGSSRGPYYMTLTDMHAGNIFVDKDWRIVSIIDLEWAGTRPLEMIHPPDWMCGQGHFMVESPELLSLHKEFIDILQFEQDQLGLQASSSPLMAESMRNGLTNGAFWYYTAVKTHALATFIWSDHLMKMYFGNENTYFQRQETTKDLLMANVPTLENTTSALEATKCEHPRKGDSDGVTQKELTDFAYMVSNLWRKGRADFIKKKLNDRTNYSQELRKAFGQQ